MNTSSAKPIGRSLNRDLAPGESAEKQIDAFISHRHAKRVAAEERERDEEAAWRESERRHIAQRRARNRLAWIRETTRAKRTAWRPL